MQGVTPVSSVILRWKGVVGPSRESGLNWTLKSKVVGRSRDVKAGLKTDNCKFKLQVQFYQERDRQSILTIFQREQSQPDCWASYSMWHRPDNQRFVATVKAACPAPVWQQPKSYTGHQHMSVISNFGAALSFLYFTTIFTSLYLTLDNDSQGLAHQPQPGGNR